MMHLLESAGHAGPWVAGGVFLALLVVALLFVRNAGKGRPHA
ncbi:MAG: hypothetical protein Q3997_06455 [Propionibacteriaceae bacterium]|nr:hypothetical protein [Propionibacteriaceae bacterium]